jgi:hypothetical protein
VSYHPKSLYLDNLTSDVQNQLNALQNNASANTSKVNAISASLNNYTLLTTTAAISANLQSQINSSNFGMAWVTISGSNQTMASNKGYITTNVGVTTLTMPSSPNPGDSISVVDSSAGGWTISLTGSQTIQISGSTQVTSSGLKLTGLANSYANLLCLSANRAILKGRGNTILQ